MFRSPSSYFSILGTPATWGMAMAWHLWRIAVGRPAFERMADTLSMAISFGLVFFLAGWLRWVVAGGLPFFLVTVGLLVMGMLMLVIAERLQRSSSLPASLLGASAAVDLTATALHFLDLVGLRHPFYSPAEIGLMLICAYRFFRSPAAVQAAGYRPLPSNSSNEKV